MKRKMSDTVQKFIDLIEKHYKEENKKSWRERDICLPTTEAQLVVSCLCDVFLGEDWYVTFPLHTTQVNTCILDEILYKYYKPYRKYVDKKNKELMKGKKNSVG